MNIKFEDLREPEPGTGQGVGEPRRGEGGRDICKCPSCGYTTGHIRDAPCNTMVCPKCGSKLTG